MFGPALGHGVYGSVHKTPGRPSAAAGCPILARFVRKGGIPPTRPLEIFVRFAAPQRLKPLLSDRIGGTSKLVPFPAFSHSA